jgi:hypothetical protein
VSPYRGNIAGLDLGKRGYGFDLVTFCLMGAACLMNACTVVIFKSIALETSFWCSAFWEYVGAAIFSLTLIGMVPSHRRALRALFGSRDAYVLVPLTLSGEAFNLLANLAVGFAGLMAPLALVSVVTGLDLVGGAFGPRLALGGRHVHSPVSLAPGLAPVTGRIVSRFAG